MRPALLALALIATTPALAAEFVPAGKQGRLKVAFIGCKSKDDAQKIKALYVAEDVEAAVKFAVSKGPGCEPLKADTVGLVEENSVWSGATCLRQKGEPDCLWLPNRLVVEK